MYDVSERHQMWCTGGGVCTGVAPHGQAGADRGSARSPASSTPASHAGTPALPPLRLTYSAAIVDMLYSLHTMSVDALLAKAAHS